MIIFKLLQFYLLIFICTSVYSQNQSTEALELLQDRIENGETKALYEIGNYLDSNKIIPTSYTLENHIYISSLARIILITYLEFFNEDFDWDQQQSASSLTLFLDSNRERLSFDPGLQVFFFTPFSDWEIEYELIGLSANATRLITSNKNYLFEIVDSIIPGFKARLKAGDSTVLLSLARSSYSNRANWFKQNNYSNLCTELLTYLTRTEINFTQYEYNDLNLDGTGSEQLELRNQVTYWSNHYKDYQWSDSLEYFVNIKETHYQYNEILKQVKAITSEQDSLALKAYIFLSTADPLMVDSALNNKYVQQRPNYILGGDFAWKHISSLSKLTQYWRQHKINYTPDNKLTSSLAKLKTQLTFPERYVLENNIIDNITFAEIRQVEYWASIHCIQFGGSKINYSVGKILDMAYSKFWDSIILNKENRNIYLYTSFYFDHFGTVGSQNNYLVKFYDSDPQYLRSMNQITSNCFDPIITRQFYEIMRVNAEQLWVLPTEINYYESYKADSIENISDAILEIYRSSIETEEKERKINKFLSKINYEQIGETIEIIRPLTLGKYWNKYFFINRDFGFPVSYIDSGFIESFLNNYKKMTEYALYSFYLDSLGVRYKNTDGSLDFNAIYKILKYENRLAFFSSGQDYFPVYAAIKILEIHFGTRLGYLPKYCYSQNQYIIPPLKISNSWMLYLQDQNLIDKKLLDEPYSWNFENDSYRPCEEFILPIKGAYK